MGRLDNTVLATVLLLALAALGTRPLAQVLSPRFAVWRAFPLTESDLRTFERFASRTKDAGTIGTAAVDPWGHPFRFLKAEGGVSIYSTGPDGKDDGGKGDDIRVEPRSGDELLTWSGAIFGGVALALLWLWGVLRLVVARRSSLGVEVFRAAGIATVPVALGGALVASAPSQVLAALGPLRAIPGVPPVASVLASIAFVAFVGGLGLRHRRGLREGAAERSPFPWRKAVLIGLAVALAGGLAAWIGVARYASWRHERLLVSARLGVGSAVNDVLESGDRDLILEFVRSGAPDFPYDSLHDSTLRAIAALGTETLPILVRALRTDPDRPVQSSYRSVPMELVARLDRHFDALAAEVTLHPVEDRAIVWNQTSILASRLGSARALELLVPFLDDRRSGLATANGYGVRICDYALEHMRSLVGKAHDFGLPEAGGKDATPGAWNAAVERAREWCKGSPTFESESWVVIRAAGLTPDPTGQCRLEVRLPGHSWGSSGSGTDKWGALGPVAPGPITASVKDSVTGTVVPVTAVAPARGTVWIDVDLAKSSAAVEVEVRGP
ncbi:MAG TPA: hypothetical protein VFF73_26905 [Planctomycetota bacterium]|nr:hypothetical protein [Planctomycetota bacterium]